MIYLDTFTFPDAEVESGFRMGIKRTCYDSFYPFRVLSSHHFERIDFEPITILYGGNGSGKTTALNVIAEKTKLQRDTIYNKSNFFSDYVDLCRFQLNGTIPKNSRILTSDDVFDYLINIRYLNEGIDNRRETIFEEYLDAKYSKFQLRSLEDYDQLKRVNSARSKSQSRFVREELMDNVREYSNGESAFRFFSEKIGRSGLYLLDEPENSLSPKRQLELIQYIEEAVRYLACQFVISTHSPFLLSLKGAKIYDLDEDPVVVKPWTKLANVQIYYEFFKQHEEEFH